jgi:hypothetical protein
VLKETKKSPALLSEPSHGAATVAMVMMTTQKPDWGSRGYSMVLL